MTINFMTRKIHDEGSQAAALPNEHKLTVHLQPQMWMTILSAVMVVVVEFS